MLRAVRTKITVLFMLVALCVYQQERARAEPISAALGLSILVHAVAAGLFAYEYHNTKAKVPSGKIPATADQCPDGQKFQPNFGCYTEVDVQLSSDYEKPLPPPPPAQLKPKVDPAYKPTAMGNSASVVVPAGTTIAEALENVNRELSQTKHAARPWYGKVKAVAVVQAASGSYNPTPAPGATANLQVAYEITGDFQLNPCAAYKVGATVHVYSSPTEYIPRTDNTCQYNMGYATTVNAGDKLMQNNAYYSAGTSVLPSFVQYTAANCDVGYTFDAAAGKCSLTAPAQVQSAPDGICAITFSTATTYDRNMFDPDCARVASQGAVQFSSDDKTVTVNSRDPVAPQKPIQQVATRDTTGATNHEVKVTDPSTGLTESIGRLIDALGKINSETPKQPTYTNPAGTVAPVTPVYVSPAPGTGAPQCGAPGMPPCSVALEGLEGLKPTCGGPEQPPCTSKVEGQCGGPGQPPCAMQGLEDGLAGIKESLDKNSKTTEETTLGPNDEDNAELDAAMTTRGHQDTVFESIVKFKGFELEDPNFTCKTAWNAGSAGDSTVPFLGESLDLHLNLADACELVEPHEDTVRQLTMAFWYVLAILLFIRLTV